MLDRKNDVVAADERIGGVVTGVAKVEAKTELRHQSTVERTGGESTDPDSEAVFRMPDLAPKLEHAGASEFSH